MSTPVTADTLAVAFPHAGDEHPQRVAELRERMAVHGLDAVAVASPESIYYLTGLDHLGYFAFTLLVVPRHGDLVVVTRAMERPTIRAQIPHCVHLTYGDGSSPAEVVIEALSVAGPSVAVEDSAMGFPPSIRDAVRAAAPDLRWADVGTLLTSAMAIKSPPEVGHMRRAAELSDAAMSAALDAAASGTSEAAVAAAVHHAMYVRGGQPPGFSPLIRPLSLLDQEHISWSERTLEPGTGLFVELSGCHRRYHAPQSRTIYVGEPPAGAADVHAAALAGLEAASDALRPGITTGEVYAAWQRAVAGDDAPAWPLRHHCGYLVGIGFPPSWVGGGEVLGIRPDGRTRVTAGMTFHLMSWVTGHVISDTVLVTDTGVDVLTTTPRDMLVVS